MGVLRFYCQVVRMAFMHALHTAHIVIFGALLLYGFAVWFGAVDWLARKTGINIDPGQWTHELEGWRTAAIVACSIIAIRLLLAPYWIWEEANARAGRLQTEIETLADQLNPPLECSCGMDVIGCTIDTVMTTRQGGIPVRYFRVRVVRKGLGSLPGCTGSLLEVRGPAGSFNEQTIALHFAPADAPDSVLKTIRSGVPEYLDIVAVTSDGSVFLPVASRPNSFPRDFFISQGEYRFSIVIASPTTPSVAMSLSFEWTGDRNTAKISSV